MPKITNLKTLGYEVGVAHSEDEEDVPTVYRVEHQDAGISVLVAEDDEEMISNLANRKLHKARLEVAKRTAAGESVALDDDGRVITQDGS